MDYHRLAAKDERAAGAVVFRARCGAKLAFVSPDFILLITICAT